MTTVVAPAVPLKVTSEASSKSVTAEAKMTVKLIGLALVGSAWAGADVFWLMVTATGGTTVSVSVALLLPGVGSVAPPGAVTVAVFERLPVAAALIVAETV